MGSTKNIGKMTLQCKGGGNCWDGMQEANAIAEAVPVNFVDFKFNGVPFPVKHFGNLIQYDNLEEMMDLFTKYSNAKNDEERATVFLEKLVGAEEKHNEEVASHTK